MYDIPATLMRGGTSKCWVFARGDVDVPDVDLDDVLRRLYGSPDSRQIDGVGGGTSTTSKAVIVSPSARPDADIDYSFAQIGVADGVVDWSSNCGNCSAAIAPYALHKGWLRPDGDVTRVRIHNTNTGQLIVAEVATPDGRVIETGAARISGVPFPGLEVLLWFVDPAGRSTGRLFPTGSTTDELDGTPATLIDAGAPLVIVRAADLGVDAAVTPRDIDASETLRARIEILRRAGAVRMGLAATADAAARAIPKFALVSEPTGDDHDFGVVMMSMGAAHPALAITGSVGLSLAATTAGTLVHDLSRGTSGSAVRLRTPSGVLTTRVGTWEGRPAVGVGRTARRLADAVLPLPVEEFPSFSRGAVPRELVVR